MANASPRDAIVALQAFAQATEEQYAANLELMRTKKGLFGGNPLSKWRRFDATGCAAAQSYADAAQGDCFVLLASVADQSKITFEPTEALLWLANDAGAVDNGAPASQK